jgi:hypothetical protein
MVVSFFGGGWCPFCTAEYGALEAAKEEKGAVPSPSVLPLTVAARQRRRRYHTRPYFHRSLTSVNDIDVGCLTAIAAPSPQSRPRHRLPSHRSLDRRATAACLDARTHEEDRT